MDDHKTIRVLAVNHTRLFGGAERSLLELLGRDVDSGATEAAIACPPGELADAAAAIGITVLPISSFEFGFRTTKRAIPSMVFNLIRASISVFKAARAFDADVIHTNSPRATMISGLAGVAGRVPILTHLRDAMPSSKRGVLARRVVLSFSRRIVANSLFTANEFRKGSGPPVDVVYNLLGSEFTDLDPTRADEFRSELDLDGTFIIGMVGQLTPWKGQDLAIRAFASVLEDGDDAKLVLVGSAKFATVGSSFENASYEEKLHELVDQLGVVDRVIFAGQRSEVSGPMQVFDITLMPSRAEPFGRAAIEAMACGSAVIATAVGGTVEFIDDDQTGLLRSPEHVEEWVAAIRRLMDDAELRTRIASKGQAEAVRRFASDSPETQVVPLYRQLLKS